MSVKPLAFTRVVLAATFFLSASAQASRPAARLTHALLGTLNTCSELNTLVPATLPAPAAYWKFNEASGTTAVDSYGSFNLNLAGGIVAGGAGKIGAGLKRTTSSGTAVSASGPTFTTQFTFAAWFKVASNSTSTVARIFHQGSVNGNESFYILATSPTQYYARLFMDTQAGVLCTDNASATRANPFYYGTFTSDTWHHLVITYNGTAMVTYQDGVAVNTQTVTGATFCTPSSRAVGPIDSSSVNVATGGLDETALWTTALSPTQVGQLYSAQNCGTR